MIAAGVVARARRGHPRVAFSLFTGQPPTRSSSATSRATRSCTARSAWTCPATSAPPSASSSRSSRASPTSRPSRPRSTRSSIGSSASATERRAGLQRQHQAVVRRRARIQRRRAARSRRRVESPDAHLEDARFLALVSVKDEAVAQAWFDGAIADAASGSERRPRPTTARRSTISSGRTSRPARTR